MSNYKICVQTRWYGEILSERMKSEVTYSVEMTRLTRKSKGIFYMKVFKENPFANKTHESDCKDLESNEIKKFEKLDAVKVIKF